MRLVIVGRRATRMQMINGEIIEFDTIIDQLGTEWIPVEAMEKFLEANHISLPIFRKRKGVENGEVNQE